MSQVFLPCVAGPLAAAGAGAVPIFFAPLTHSLVPTIAGNPTATFTRATTAYVTDFEGVLRNAIAGEARFHGARRVRNWIAPASTQDFSAWTRTNTSVTFGVQGPTGLNDANTVTATVNGGQLYTSANNLNTTGTGPVTARSSMWLRRRTGTGAITFRNPDGTAFDIAPQLDGTWKRFTSNVTGIPASNALIALTFSIAGDAVDAAYAQTETVDGQSNQAPAEYVSNGVLAAPFHGNAINGVKYFTTTCGNSVVGNVVVEAAGTPIPDATLLGYVAENAATNLCLRSQEFDNATWVKTNVTVTPNTHAAPDGTITADTLAATGALGTLTQSITVTAVAHTASYFLKRLVGTGTVELIIDGTATDITAQINASTYARPFSTKTLTAGAKDFTLRISTSGDSLIGWGAQVEATEWPTSYIPTTTAAVIRNVDALSFPAAANISGTIGTSYVEFYFQYPWTSNNRDIVRSATPSHQSNWIIGTSNVHGVYFSPRATTVNARLVGAINKGISTWDAAGATTCLNGGAVPATTAQQAIFTSGNVQLGGSTPNSLNGFLRNVKFYATRLTDVELQTLTAP